ncbi:MAG: Mur ligase family protein [Clostridia bacterium]
MGSTTLGCLVAGLPGHGIGGGWEQAAVLDVVIDSRTVRPGSLFVALPGHHSHGALHIGQAVAAGAAAVLVPEDWAAQVPPGVAGFASPHITRALAIASARLYRNPGSVLRLSAVTGTNGKTTVVTLLAHILRTAGFATVYWSTAFINDGHMTTRPRYTTPPAPELHRFLAEAAARGNTDAVVEVSSHALVLDRVYGLDFAVAAVTNLSPDHLDFHGSLAAYARAKRILVEALSPDATAVLNADDPVVSAYRLHTRARVLTFGFASADIWAAIDALSPTESRFHLCLPDDPPQLVRMQLPGRHNVANAMAAAGLAIGLGIPSSVIHSAIESFQAPVRRLEADRIGPYTVINDVAMNRASYEAVMGAMRDAEPDRLVVVNAIRGNRGVEVNRDIAEILALWSRRFTRSFAPLVVTTSDRHAAAFPDDYRVRPEELQAFLAMAAERDLPCEVFRELPDALDHAIDRLQGGGTLLLLGTFGMDDGPALAIAKLEDRLLGLGDTRP